MSLPRASYESLYALCRTKNTAPDGLSRALLLAGVMRWFAAFRGFPEAAEEWAAMGLARHSGLDDVALADAGLPEEWIAALRRNNVADADAQAPLSPEDELYCLLVTLDHLSALVVASAATRPKGSVQGLKVSAVQKKFRDSHFCPEASRMTILQGARRMRWEIGNLTSKTIQAVLSCEAEVREAARKIA